jgi:threonine/homoserine/homoserine lactone efflux protein
MELPKLIKIFFTGMVISFLGSLPLGTLNVAAMQMAITDGLNPAMLFGLGIMTTELIYVRLSLIAMDWVRKQKKLLKALEWFTLVIVLALAISSFYAALHPHVSKNVILSSNINKYLLGLMMCAVNPVQIPFWFGWSTVLFTKKILLPKNSHYNFYIAGIGIGTLLGTAVFIFGGKLIAEKIGSSQSMLNWIIGGIFTITALIQLIKILRHKDIEHKIDHPEEMTNKIEHQLPS